MLHMSEFVHRISEIVLVLKDIYTQLHNLESFLTTRNRLLVFSGKENDLKFLNDPKTCTRGLSRDDFVFEVTQNEEMKDRVQIQMKLMIALYTRMLTLASIFRKTKIFSSLNKLHATNVYDYVDSLIPVVHEDGTRRYEQDLEYLDSSTEPASVCEEIQKFLFPIDSMTTFEINDKNRLYQRLRENRLIEMQKSFYRNSWNPWSPDQLRRLAEID